MIAEVLHHLRQGSKSEDEDINLFLYELKRFHKLNNLNIKNKLNKFFYEELEGYAKLDDDFEIIVLQSFSSFCGLQFLNCITIYVFHML